MTTMPLEPEILADEYLSREVLESRLPDGGPEFLCPLCGGALRYQGSFRAAATGCPLDLTDRYACPAGCGRFEHERRTHRARRAGRSSARP